MQVINVRNVNDALIQGMDLLKQHGIKRSSRVGDVYEFPEPVTTVYAHPEERVLFWEERNANPFFHFMESLWMLNGQKDLGWIQTYNKSFERYSDDGKTIHGAYGYRWREQFGKDQINTITKRLLKNPEDRRCVLQMWDPKADLDSDSVDVPCNTVIYFKVNDNEELDMTVSNRSNDIIWGAYGANAVHMSMLQEYVARIVGVDVGRYYQVSNNFHAYVDVFDELYEKLNQSDTFDFYMMKHDIARNPYRTESVKPFPIKHVPCPNWSEDLSNFIASEPLSDDKYFDNFFNNVAVPLRDAWAYHKLGQTEEALIEVQSCQATDWQKAGYEWLRRKA